MYSIPEENGYVLVNVTFSKFLPHDILLKFDYVEGSTSAYGELTK